MDIDKKKLDVSNNKISTYQKFVVYIRTLSRSTWLGVTIVTDLPTRPALAVLPTRCT